MPRCAGARGAGASRLVSGTMTVHRRLEERAGGLQGHRVRGALRLGLPGQPRHHRCPSAIGDRHRRRRRAATVVFSDELNHASLIDGCRLARAETFVYDHCDVEHLAWGLRQHRDRASLIVTDSVFSMDGDIAPLTEIAELAHRHGARTIVDEAHGTGCLGPGGRGAVAEAGLEGEIDVVVGTLGKALGAYGAFAACSAAMRDLLTNTARSLIFLDRAAAARGRRRACGAGGAAGAS